MGCVRRSPRMFLKRILKGCGVSMADVVTCSVLLRDRKDFATMNEVYAEFFGDKKPARTSVEAKSVPEMKVEIDCIAYEPK
jgi:2-iminobutanoate/2-iminopropanoate deaminase